MYVHKKSPFVGRADKVEGKIIKKERVSEREGRHTS